MRIKKFRNNEYVLSDGIWVRNPFSSAEPLDINDLERGEMSVLLENEIRNMTVSGIYMDSLNRSRFENVVICSDGYDWEERRYALAGLPGSVKVIGVNGSLARWGMVGEGAKATRGMAFYVVNNPYRECMKYLPREHRYYPNLLASTKTFPGFLKEYRNEPHFYKSTKNLNYSGMKDETELRLDDYRNPVCAAISFSVFLGVKRLVLFCCDEAFSDERPNAESMRNGLRQYPQQMMCQRIIDRQLHWLRSKGVAVADCSSGSEYENADYIKIEELASFFETKNELLSAEPSRL